MGTFSLIGNSLFCLLFLKFSKSVSPLVESEMTIWYNMPVINYKDYRGNSNVFEAEKTRT